MPWGVAAGAAIAAGGSYLASESAKDAANTQANAMRGLSEQQYARAQEAAARTPEFKPVTVTSSFGTPQYTYDSTGRLTGVSSTAAPWLANLQTTGQGMAGQYQNIQQQSLMNTGGLNASNLAFGQTPQLYNLANQALPQSYDTTQATKDYYNQMQGLVAADRERQLAGTRQNLFNTGRSGLAIGATQAGGELASNPEMAAYYNAIAKADANMAMQAKSQALADLQSRQNLGTGLLTAANQQTAAGGNALNQYYTNLSAAQSPFSTQMSQQSALEAMQNQPVTQGMAYGTNVTNQANTIAQGYMNAAGAGAGYSAQAINAQAAADAQNPWAGVLIGAGQAIGGANWGSVFSSPSSSYTGSPSTPSGYGNAANIYYGNKPQMFSNQNGWSY